MKEKSKTTKSAAKSSVSKPRSNKPKTENSKPVERETIPDAPEGMLFPKLEPQPKKVILPEITRMMKSTDFNLSPETQMKNNFDLKAGQPSENTQSQPMQPNESQQPPELRVYQVPTIIEEGKTWGTLVQVTPWVNGTGYEIILCNKNGAFQHLSITKEEIDLINEMIKKLKG